ncbi:hypothetical protein BHM03_00041877 [Ensete ventricosum]|nr:hypothetical protein BHM03_00041877 [Ensete ventricosum]
MRFIVPEDSARFQRVQTRPVRPKHHVASARSPMGGQRGERSLWRPIKLTDVVREQAICQFVSPRPSRWFLFVRRLLSSREKENTWEMDSFFRSRSKPSFGSSWSYDSLKNLRHIQPAVQNHLKLVRFLEPWPQGTRSCPFLYFNRFLFVVTHNTYCFLLEQRKRFGFLMAASVLEGASVGPLIELAIDFDPSLVYLEFTLVYVVGAPPRSGSPHNGVQAASTRGAPHKQFEVGVCGCSGCDFDAGPSNLAGLFLQDKTSSRVVGSRDGPSDDQVRVVLKGEVRRLLLGCRSFSF